MRYSFLRCTRDFEKEAIRRKRRYVEFRNNYLSLIRGHNAFYWKVCFSCYKLLLTSHSLFHLDYFLSELFVGRNHNELFSAIVGGKYSFPDQYWANVSPDAKELIQNLLQVNPDHRWTARQALQCRWFQKLAGEELAQNDLSKSARELKFFNARLKFKAAVIGVALIQGWERRKTKKENDNDLMSVCS